jgi:hypothetical protein
MRNKYKLQYPINRSHIGKKVLIKYYDDRLRVMTGIVKDFPDYPQNNCDQVIIETVFFEEYIWLSRIRAVYFI